MGGCREPMRLVKRPEKRQRDGGCRLMMRPIGSANTRIASGKILCVPGHENHAIHLRRGSDYRIR
jgi:hypothetical protein